MNHPFHIEHAAADRRAADLKAGAEARLVRAARENLIAQRRFGRLVARIRRLITGRLGEALPIAPADSSELPGDAPATVR